VIGLPVYAAARWIADLSQREAIFTALGIGLAGCETTRQAVRWAVDRGAEPGPLLKLLEALAGTDDVVPLLHMINKYFYANLYI